MKCEGCGAPLAPGAAQCSVGFAAVTVGPASPPASTARSSAPIPGVSVPPVHSGPSPVLPPRANPAGMSTSSRWGISGFGGGFLGLLLLVLRLAGPSYQAYERTEQRSSPPSSTAYAQQHLRRTMQTAESALPPPARGPAVGIPSGSASAFPSIPSMPLHNGPDFAAQQRMRDLMAADQQRLRQQMDESRQRMHQQALEAREQMQRQMDEMRIRLGGPGARSIGPGGMGGLGGPAGPPGFPGRVGPPELGGPRFQGRPSFGSGGTGFPGGPP